MFPGRQGEKPEFTTISSRTVIPDQGELDQVDEDALKIGHEPITVDKDNQIVTEVIEGEREISSIRSKLFPLEVQSDHLLLI